MSLDSNPLDTWKHAQWERYCQISAATLIGYEYLLQFDNEVKLFRKKRWSIGKALFLWSRYYSFSFTVANAIVYVYDSPSVEFCTKFFHWQSTGATLQLLTTHVILELRLYAMYQGSRFILTVLSMLLLGEAIAMIIIIGTNKPGVRAQDFHSITNEPLPGLLICADGDPPGQHWVAYYFTTVLIIESTLLALSLWKSWQHYRSGSVGDIIKLLTRDSVLYFFAMFWLYLLVQIVWLKNKITLNELATGLSYSVGAVLANRLMINIRLSYYGDESQVIELDLPQQWNRIQFRRRRNLVPTEDMMNYELKSFDDHRGF